MTNRQKIGSVIKRHRKKSKLSFRKLGELSGIKWSTIHSLEIGRGDLGAAQLASLTKVFGSDFANEVLDIAKAVTEERPAHNHSFTERSRWSTHKICTHCGLSDVYASGTGAICSSKVVHR